MPTVACSRKPDLANRRRRVSLTSSTFSSFWICQLTFAAIFYAQLFARHQHGQPGWKFNKAKQGWLIRNYFDTLPDHHLDVVTEYLKTVVGGVRTALIKKAQECRDAPTAEEAAKAAKDENGEKKKVSFDVEAEEDDKEVDPSKGAEGQEEESAGDEKEESTDSTVIESRRKRAETLLAAMSS